MQRGKRGTRVIDLYYTIVLYSMFHKKNIFEVKLTFEMLTV